MMQRSQIKPIVRIPLCKLRLFWSNIKPGKCCGTKYENRCKFRSAEQSNCFVTHIIFDNERSRCVEPCARGHADHNIAGRVHRHHCIQLPGSCTCFDTLPMSTNGVRIVLVAVRAPFIGVTYVQPTPIFVRTCTPSVTLTTRTFTTCIHNGLIQRARIRRHIPGLTFAMRVNTRVKWL